MKILGMYTFSLKKFSKRKNTKDLLWQNDVKKYRLTSTIILGFNILKKVTFYNISTTIMAFSEYRPADHLQVVLFQKHHTLCTNTINF